MPGLDSRYRLKLGCSLLIAAAMVVPLAAVGVSVWQRNAQLDRIASPDPDVRERALNAFIRHAAEDARWVSGLTARLDDLPADAMLPVLNAMRVAGVAGDDRFFIELAGTLERLSASDLMGVAVLADESPALFKQALVTEGIVRLRRSPTSDSWQRWIAMLDRAGAWRSPPVPIDIYVAWLAEGVEAASPAIRIRAARWLGDVPLDHPGVAAPIIVEPLRRLMRDTDPQVRRAAVWAVAGVIHQDSTLLDDLKHLSADSDLNIRADTHRLVRIWMRDETDRGETRSLSAGEETPAIEAEAWEGQLAVLESRPPASINVTYDEAMPHHVRVAAVRAGRNAKPAWLRSTLRVNDRPALRDAAAVTLTQRFGGEQLRPFVEELLEDRDPDARRSAAVLSGLTGLARPALEAAAQRENTATVKRAMKIGLWMQSRAPRLDGQTAALLDSEIVADSTLLLAMFHAGQGRSALDHLLAVGVNQPDDPMLRLRQTAELLWGERWLVILRTYLPGDAPRLPVNPDAAAAMEWLADVRAWHALHRLR